MPDPRRGFDCRRRQPVDRERIADHLQHAQFFLVELEIDGDDLDGNGVGGLLQAGLEGLGDLVEQGIEPGLVDGLDAGRSDFG